MSLRPLQFASQNRQPKTGYVRWWWAIVAILIIVAIVVPVVVVTTSNSSSTPTPIVLYTIQECGAQNITTCTIEESGAFLICNDTFVVLICTENKKRSHELAWKEMYPDGRGWISNICPIDIACTQGYILFCNEHSDPNQLGHVYVCMNNNWMHLGIVLEKSQQFLLHGDRLDLNLDQRVQYNDGPLTTSATSPVHFDVVHGTLPLGMTLDRNTGFLHGAPIPLGSFPVTFQANLRETDILATIDITLQVKTFEIHCPATWHGAVGLPSTTGIATISGSGCHEQLIQMHHADINQITVIVRTFTATDSCGIQKTCEQQIVFPHTPKPVLQCRAPTLACFDEPIGVAERAHVELDGETHCGPAFEWSVQYSVTGWAPTIVTRKLEAVSHFDPMDVADENVGLYAAADYSPTQNSIMQSSVGMYSLDSGDVKPMQYTTETPCNVPSTMRAIRWDYKTSRFVYAYMASTMSDLCISIGDKTKRFDFPGVYASNFTLAVWGMYYTVCFNNVNEDCVAQCHVFDRSLEKTAYVKLSAGMAIPVHASSYAGVRKLTDAPCGIITNGAQIYYCTAVDFESHTLATVQETHGSDITSASFMYHEATDTDHLHFDSDRRIISVFDANATLVKFCAATGEVYADSTCVSEPQIRAHSVVFSVRPRMFAAVSDWSAFPNAVDVKLTELRAATATLRASAVPPAQYHCHYELQCSEQIRLDCFLGPKSKRAALRDAHLQSHIPAGIGLGLLVILVILTWLVKK